MKPRKQKNILIIAGLIVFALPSNGLGQTGDQFTLTQTVTAAGGGSSSGGIFALEATAGQTAAGAAAGSPFGLSSGFWNFTPLPPTAATASISGHVRTAEGAGIRNAVVTLVSRTGEIRTLRTKALGFFRFEQIAVGQIYTLSVSAKKFTFAQPVRVIALEDDVTDADFIANF